MADVSCSKITLDYLCMEPYTKNCKTENNDDIFISFLQFLCYKLVKQVS